MDIPAKLLKLQRFGSINYTELRCGDESKYKENKQRKSTKSRDTINKIKVVKIVNDSTTQERFVENQKSEVIRLRKHILVYTWKTKIFLVLTTLQSEFT